MPNSTAGSVHTGGHAEDLADKPLVMIAEDDTELRSLLADTLIEEGCVVRTAADGRELLAMLSAVSRGEIPMPALIVTDVRMPRCSGMDVLAALRLAGWEVPVVIITGFGDGQVHANAGTLGAAIVLDKPFDFDTLRAVVRLSLRSANAPLSSTNKEDATLESARPTKRDRT